MKAAGVAAPGSMPGTAIRRWVADIPDVLGSLTIDRPNQVGLRGALPNRHVPYEMGRL